MIQKGVASPYLESILRCVRLCLALTKQEDIVSSRVTGTIEATFLIYFLLKGIILNFYDMDIPQQIFFRSVNEGSHNMKCN